jgi:hypothetical protein
VWACGYNIIWSDGKYGNLSLEADVWVEINLLECKD